MWLVFSDLDGTLLNKEDYSYAEASTALEQLVARQIPLILATSKTTAEVISLRETMQLTHPFVVENGAGVCIPQHYFSGLDAPLITVNDQCFHQVLLGTPYSVLRQQVARWQKAGYQVRGFGDMNQAEVMQRTGLSAHAARQSLLRCGTEPLVIDANPQQLAELQQQANAQQLRLVKGGRFWHLMGHFDKADGCQLLLNYYQQHYSAPLKTIALGDSANDWGMLRQADIGVILPPGAAADLSPASEHRIIEAPYPGPRGWQHVMLALLSEQETQHG